MLYDVNSPSSKLLNGIMKKVNALGHEPRVVVELDQYRYVPGVMRREEVIDYVSETKARTMVTFGGNGGVVNSTMPALPLAKASLDDMVMTSPFGKIRRSLGQDKPHTGTDYDLQTGDPVRTIWAGKVSFADTAGGYGKLVKVDHGNGIETRYAHLSKIEVAKGDYVAKGETIGLGGSTGFSTGSHLHMEVLKTEGNKDPVRYDPHAVLKGLVSLVTEVEGQAETETVLSAKLRQTFVDYFGQRPVGSKYTLNDAIIFKENVPGVPPYVGAQRNYLGFDGGGTFKFRHKFMQEGTFDIDCFADIPYGTAVAVNYSYKPFGSDVVTTGNVYTFTEQDKGVIYPPVYKTKPGEYEFTFEVSPGCKFGITYLRCDEFEEVYEESKQWDYQDAMNNAHRWEEAEYPSVFDHGAHVEIKGGQIIREDVASDPMTILFKAKVTDGVTKAGLRVDNMAGSTEFFISPTMVVNGEDVDCKDTWHHFMVTIEDEVNVYMKVDDAWHRIVTKPLAASGSNNHISLGTFDDTFGSLFLDDIKYVGKVYTSTQVDQELVQVKGHQWFEVGGFVLEKTHILEEDILNWEVNSHYDTQISTAKITLANVDGIYSPNYKRSALFPDNMKESPYTYFDAGEMRHVISEYTPIRIYAGYGSELVRVFTGLIKGEITEDSVDKTMAFNAVDMYDKIKECVLYEDTSFPPKQYYEGDETIYMWLKSSVVQALAVKAGMTGWRRHHDDLQYPDLLIEDTFFTDIDYGTQTAMKVDDTGKAAPVQLNSVLTEGGYLNPFLVMVSYGRGDGVADCIDELKQDINFRSYCDRYGTFRFEHVDFTNNMKWTFREGDELLELDSATDFSRVRNHLIITGDGKRDTHFFDQDLVVACKGHIRTGGVVAPWIQESNGQESEGIKKEMAESIFWNMKRSARTKSVVVKGNPLIDVMDGCYVFDSNTSTSGYYIIKGNRLVGDTKGMLNFLELTWETQI